MKRKRRLAASLSRILILVAILAPLTPLSLPRAKVTSAQTETTLSAPVLSATAAGSSAIDLSWTAVPGAVRYELHTQLVDDPGWRQLDGGNLEGTTFRHGDLTPGKRYQYAVRAIDANDQPLGPWSNYPTETVPSSEAATSTSTPTPRATQSSTTLTAPVLTATAAGSNAIDLSWTSVSGAVRYALFTQLVDDPGWQQIDGGNLRGTSFRHGELEPGVTYQYAVRAIDANNQELGPWSNFPTETVPASTTGTSTATPTATPVAPAPGAQRTALTALYNATDGANWTNNANWLTNQPLSAWHGVTTDANGRVTHLRLSGNGLRGPIPNLSALAYLEELLLSSNLLSGPIPQLNALTKLTWLDLSHNRLTGSIPDLNAPVRLTELSFAFNQLSGTIPDLSALTNLIVLSFARNQLSGSIPDLSALANLGALNLGHNRLRGPVPDLSALANLSSLALQHNRLNGPLPDLSVLSNLTQLNLTANQFCLPDGRDASGLHSAVAAHLRTLTLAPCTDAGTPTSTHTATPTATASALSAPSLTATAAGSNAIDLSWTSVPGAVRYALFTQLVDDPGWQQLDGGNLRGTSYRHGELEPGVTYQYAVRAIDANNQPLGPWSNFPTETVPASDAPTSTPAATSTPTSTPRPGATPTATSTASALSAPSLTATAAGSNAIDLNWTPVRGAVRYVLFTQLVAEPGWQQLDGGNLRGTSYRHDELEPGVTYQYAVRAIDANNQPLGPWSNFPTETVPASTTGTSTATATATTAAPAPGAQRAALTALYNATDGANWTRSDNWLTNQPLSAWHGVATDANGRVTRLLLGANQLRGTIPDLSALANLEDLHLHTNQLSGTIPDLRALANLTKLSLSHNRLSGPIPDLSALTNLEDLHLHSNQLTGSIPDLSALANLRQLDLSHNRLSGPLPDLSVLSNLVHLDLTANQFCLPDGARPTGLHSAVAAHLRTLNLAPCTDAGTPTPTATASTTELTIPSLSAQATENGIVLTWQAVPGAVRYELLTLWANDAGWQAIGGPNLTGTTYTHTTVTAGTTYRYSIRALNAAGDASPWLTGGYPSATARGDGGRDRNADGDHHARAAAGSGRGKGRSGCALQRNQRRQLDASRQLVDRRAALRLVRRVHRR